MFIVFINSGYALTTAFPLLSTISLVALWISLFIIALYYHRTLIDYSGSTYLSILLLILTFLNFVANSGYTNLPDYLQYTILLSSAYLINRVFTFEDFVKIYLKFMQVICIIALIGHIIIQVYGIPSFLPVVSNAFTSYVHVILFFVIQEAPQRLTGIFWEPGVFQCYLYFALFFEFFSKNRKSKFNIILFITCILFTASTTAIYLFPLFIFVALSEFGTRKIFLLYSTILVLMIFIYFYYSGAILNELNVWFPSVFGKLVTENDSFLFRKLNIVADMQIFLRNPIFGVGRHNMQSSSLLEYGNLGVLVNSRTSTISYFMASMGGVFALVFSFGLIKAWTNLVKAHLSKIVTTLIIIIIITVEPFMSSLFLYTIIFFLLGIKTTK